MRSRRRLEMSEPRLTGTKHCNHCDRDLPVICFSVCRGNSDGLATSCRECDRKVIKVRVARSRKKPYYSRSDNLC